MKAQWHFANGQFREVEVLEDPTPQSEVPIGKQIADPVKIKDKKMVRVVPAFELYQYTRPHLQAVATDGGTEAEDTEIDETQTEDGE